MKTDIKSGSINGLGEKYKGWFIGHFVDAKTPFSIKDFEVKWINHKKGEVKKNLNPSKNEQKTLGILIEGSFKMTFTESNETFILDEQGQYIYFKPNSSHLLTALSDTTVLIIRWPSEY